MSNPYTKTFGKIPRENISRTAVIDGILHEFNKDNPESPIYILSGACGSGKTVTLTEIAFELQKDKKWICIEINSSSENMLKSLVAQLYAKKPVFGILSKTSINLSYLGLGVEMKGEPPVTDYAIAAEKILECIKKSGLKVAVTIDEIIDTKSAREFIQQFQIYIRHELPIYLAATALCKDFEKMKNAPGMTFLYRAQRISLAPLDKISIANSYQRNIKGTDREKALQMAKFTMGYSFGFQVLGYICYETGEDFMSQTVLQAFDHEMYEKVYGKIWSEATKLEREYLNGMANAESSKIEDIRRELGIDNNHFNPIRKRFIDQGIAKSEANGYLVFCLPRFAEFVKESYLLEN